MSTPAGPPPARVPTLTEVISVSTNDASAPTSAPAPAIDQDQLEHFLERVLAQASEWRLGAQGAANEELGELAPVVRAAIHWGRHTETAIDDILY